LPHVTNTGRKVIAYRAYINYECAHMSANEMRFCTISSYTRVAINEPWVILVSLLVS